MAKASSAGSASTWLVRHRTFPLIALTVVSAMGLSSMALVADEPDSAPAAATVDTVALGSPTSRAKPDEIPVDTAVVALDASTTVALTASAPAPTVAPRLVVNAPSAASPAAAPAPPTATTAPPSSTSPPAPVPPTTVPPVTAPPTTAPPATLPPTTTAPGSTNTLTYTFSGVATEILITQTNGSAISVASVTLAAGWRYFVSANGPSEIHIDFRRTDDDDEGEAAWVLVREGSQLTVHEER